MFLIKRSCPKCKYVLEGWQRGYRGFGSPIISCPNCQYTIKRDHINEWGLMNLLQKANYIFSLFWQIVVISFGIGFLIGLMFYFLSTEKNLFVYKTIAPVSETFQNFTPLTYYIFFFSLLVVGIYETLSFIRSVRESIKRLNNPDYRNMLNTFGLLKDD